ncbi:hypothetical protein E2C01_063711 [Portunus trituberculatus]|uniref:Uncharacterized protein n=1 Tax=Portunus trituberculatus TaxID=210409 RepID=A0A5B7HIW2_PORTR|nr:hypothetical protein [Portunus trituberculatus]
MSDPKLFYKYISDKTKIKSANQRLNVDGEIIEEEREIVQVLNNKFKEVFMEVTDQLEEQERQGEYWADKLESIDFDREEIVKRLQSLDVNKALGC